MIHEYIKLVPHDQKDSLDIKVKRPPSWLIETPSWILSHLLGSSLDL